MKNLAENLVIIETMPDHLRAAHRAAGNWGAYPHNGATRLVCDRDVAEQESAEDEYGYTSIVRAATESDLADYDHHWSARAAAASRTGRARGRVPRSLRGRMRNDVVALYVDAKGSYPQAVAEWYDEKRDARTYAGDLPIVGHPPCQRWCQLAGLVEARWGHKRGDDGGLFAHALATVRRVGGVLEHPAYSAAWAAHGLPKPPTGGGWVPGAVPGEEWTCYVEQWRYGHRAKKATWLYYCGSQAPLELRWGHLHDSKAMATWDAGRARSKAQREAIKEDKEDFGLAWVSWCGNKTRNGGQHRPRLTHKEAIHTPPEFQTMLLDLAAQSRRVP